MSDPATLATLTGAFSICFTICYCSIGILQLGMIENSNTDERFRRKVSNLNILALIFLILSVLTGFLLIF